MRWIVLLVGVLAGCGSSDEPDVRAQFQDLNIVCVDTVFALCACNMAGPTDAECTAYRVALAGNTVGDPCHARLSDVGLSIDDGRMSVDTTEADKCAAALETAAARDCAQLPIILSNNCQNVVVPHQDAGEKCATNYDCKSGSCIDRACE